MKKNTSSLEQHAAELGLTQEDAAPIEPEKPAVATADKVLLGVGCCLLAAVSAAISVWMVVPTLIITGAAAALSVRHLNAANAISPRPISAAAIQLGGEAVQRMMKEDQERFSSWNRNTVLNPLFRTSLSNISYDDHHRD